LHFPESFLLDRRLLGFVASALFFFNRFLPSQNFLKFETLSAMLAAPLDLTRDQTHAILRRGHTPLLISEAQDFVIKLLGFFLR